jgi:hypothetical protein
LLESKYRENINQHWIDATVPEDYFKVSRYLLSSNESTCCKNSTSPSVKPLAILSTSSGNNVFKTVSFSRIYMTFEKETVLKTLFPEDVLSIAKGLTDGEVEFKPLAILSTSSGNNVFKTVSFSNVI